MHAAEQSKTAFSRWIAIVGTVLTICFIIAYFYLVKTGRAEPLLASIRAYGIWGVLVCIALLALFCILPVPSEFLIIINMELYGAEWGIFYSWIGGIIGAVGALFVTKWVARPLIERLAGRYLEQVDTWIKRRGTIGLLAVRFIPFVPYHLVNYIAGVIQVRLWAFIWTTAIGILPFDLVMAGAFAGFRHGAIVWGIVGGVVAVILIALSIIFRKQWFVDAVR